MTLAMSHRVDDDGRLLVLVMASGCRCEFVVHIDTPDRMGNYETRVQPKRTPKEWYREAENILLSGDRVYMSKHHDVDMSLECKQHKGN